MHQRHTPVFAIVAAPYLTENISLMVQRAGVFEKIRSFSSYAMLSAFLCILVGYQLFFAGYKYIKAQCNIIVDPTKYPVSAIHFLKQNGIKGNILFLLSGGNTPSGNSILTAGFQLMDGSGRFIRKKSSQIILRPQ